MNGATHHVSSDGFGAFSTKAQTRRRPQGTRLRPGRRTRLPDAGDPLRARGRMRLMPRGRRTIIDISAQPDLEFESDEYVAEFTLPAYQRGLLLPRVYAMLTDFAIVLAIFALFVFVTMSEMPEPVAVTRTLGGVYAAAYLLFLVAYLALFMLSASRTAGMRLQRLVVVNHQGRPLAPREALMRAFGYLISTAPVLFGLLWAFVDPEHLTWADKVSHTFVKRA